MCVCCVLFLVVFWCFYDGRRDNDDNKDDGEHGGSEYDADGNKDGVDRDDDNKDDAVVVDDDDDDDDDGNNDSDSDIILFPDDGDECDIQ